MDRAEILFLVPYFISLLVSIVVGFYTWQRRSVEGATAFLSVIAIEVLYILVYVFHLISETIQGKIFWDNLRYVISALGPATVLFFGIQFTRRKLDKPVGTWVLVSIFPLGYLFLLFTDNYHHLIRPEVVIEPGEPFSILVYEFTPITYFLFFHSFIVALIGIITLISGIVSPRKPFRSQIIAVVVGILIPLLGAALPLMDIKLFTKYDPSQITLFVGNVVIAWGLFRYRLFDLVPIARDRLIEKMLDAVLVMDVQDRIVDANPAAVSIFDLNGSDIAGKPVAQVIPQWETLGEQSSENNANSHEIVLGEDESQRDFSARITKLFDEGGEYAGQFIVLREITDLKQAERKIRRYNSQLQSLNLELEDVNDHLVKLSQVKDRFVANVSHELRTPLTNIKLYHELLALQPDRIREHLDILSRETDRLTSLIENILALSRFDQNVVRLDKSTFDINTLIDEYVEDRKAMAETRGLSLGVGERQEIPPLYADRNLTGQVLSIILTNAINYTPIGGEILINSVSLQQQNGSPWVGFSVQDTGMGLTADDIENLFTRFYRGKVGNKSGVSGTGLGLSIAKEIIDRHHGEIQVDSSGVPGEGTTFQVFFPPNDE